VSDKPRVSTRHSDWNKENGLRIVVMSEHDGFNAGRMYSVDDARYLANELLEACAEIDSEEMKKESFCNMVCRRLKGGSSN
jgi:hypothetical protein